MFSLSVLVGGGPTYLDNLWLEVFLRNLVPLMQRGRLIDETGHNSVEPLQACQQSVSSKLAPRVQQPANTPSWADAFEYGIRVTRFPAMIPPENHPAFRSTPSSYRARAPSPHLQVPPQNAWSFARRRLCRVWSCPPANPGCLAHPQLVIAAQFFTPPHNTSTLLTRATSLGNTVARSTCPMDITHLGIPRVTDSGGP